jgi:hypothetical protein
MRIGGSVTSEAASWLLDTIIDTADDDMALLLVNTIDSHIKSYALFMPEFVSMQ